MEPTVDTLVDLDWYPVLDPTGAAYRAVVEDARAQLVDTGAV